MSRKWSFYRSVFGSTDHNTDKWQHNDNYINDVAQVNKIFANTAYIKEVFRIRVFKSGYGFGNFFSSSWIRIQMEKKPKQIPWKTVL